MRASTNSSEKSRAMSVRGANPVDRANGGRKRQALVERLGNAGGSPSARVPSRRYAPLRAVCQRRKDSTAPIGFLSRRLKMRAQGVFFDIFSTIVDWRDGVARGTADPASRFPRHGLDRFRRRLARAVPGGMEEIRSGRESFLPKLTSSASQPRTHRRFRPVGHFRSDETPARARLAQAGRLAGRRARARVAAQERSPCAGLERQFLADGGARAQQFSLGRDPSSANIPATTSPSRLSISRPARPSI